MTAQAQRVLREALALPESERTELVSRLIDSLEATGETEPAVDVAWQAEVKRRVRELDEGVVETIAWDDVKRDLLGRSGPDDR